jgi:protein TonB
LLGSIILHIIVIAGVGISIHKAPLELDKITYFQLVTDIRDASSPVERSGLKTANFQGIPLALRKADPGSVRLKLPITTTNFQEIQKSPALDSEKPGTEMVKEDSKPPVDNGPGQFGPGVETSPVGTLAANSGTGSGVINFDSAGTSGDGILVIPPHRIYSPNPEYPGIAKRNNWQGLVTLRALIKMNGTIGEITVFQSSGFEVLDRSALLAVKKWRYQPALRQGTAVECYLRIPVRFKLGE